MQSTGWKSFWMAFWMTALVLVPLVGGTLLLARHEETRRALRTAESQSNVPVRVPAAEDQLSVLVCVADDPAAFLLVRLDANAQKLGLLVVPGRSAVAFGEGETTLAHCYASAGPARCVQGLETALGIEIDRYLAIGPATLEKAAQPFEPLRVGLTGVLTPAQLTACGQSEAIRDWTAKAAHAFIQTLEQYGGEMPELGRDPALPAGVRAVLWEAFFRQRLEQLPKALPALLRRYSPNLLTDLTAVDLYVLEETLEFLANDGCDVTGGLLPGRWEEETGFYTLEEEAAAAAQALLSASASGAQREEESAPYPSTSVPAGQREGSA